jgi:acyl homoserine lactone synthase
MLEGVFPSLINQGSYKKSATIWESSRFAIDTEMGGREGSRLISPYTLELFVGMLEYGIINGWSDIVTVTDLRLERVLGIARWPLHRIGEEKEIGSTVAVAGLVDISQATLENVRKIAHITSSVLKNTPDTEEMDIRYFRESVAHSQTASA